MAQFKVLLFFPVIAALLMAFANPKPIAQKAEQSLKTVFPALAEKAPHKGIAQTHSEMAVADYKSTPTVIDDTTKKDPIYLQVEQMPEFPGGMTELVTFLGSHLRYPLEADQKDIEGKVFVRFIVDKEGNVKEPEIARSIGGGCDEEAIRVVKLFPKWKPGYQNGKPVNAYFVLPIKFQLIPKRNETKLEEREVTNENNIVFLQVEKMPEYPGGIEELIKFINNNLKYPQNAIDLKIEGHVFVKFIIDKEGNISKPTILRGIGGGCDEEAIRIVNLFPKWKPGSQNGHLVNVSFTLPINFKLSSKKK
ncbi:MAG: energy transducer TonB [Bacteroidota bacterium]|nr:energy transducer TonB [Bacteroidota bacterium]